MAGGLAVTGLAGYGFVALSGHTLSTADAATLTSLYLVVNIVGPGLFAALEQEASRAVSARRAAGGGLGPVLRRAGWICAGGLVALLAVLAAISPVLTGRVLAGHWGLFAAVLLSVPTSAAVYLVRGLLGGNQRFAGYAATLAVEGLLRLVPCLFIAFAGTPDAVGYALVFAAGSGFGALAGLPWLRRLGGGTAQPDTGSLRGMATGTAVLAGATLLTLAVANLAPVVVTARLVTDPAVAAAFASTFVLVRFPVLLFAPVGAMLLPTLTAAATRGDRDVLRGRVRLGLFAVAGIGAIAVLGAFAAGPWAVRILFGAQVSLPAWLVGALAISTAGILVAQVLQPALVALGRHRLATGSWLAGTVILIGCLALPGDPVRAAVIGQLAGCAVVALGMFGSLRRALRIPHNDVGPGDNTIVAEIGNTIVRTLIVVPAWNEEQSVGSTIAEIRAALPAVDVLVVDDGSTDRTAGVAAEAGALVLRLPFNLGVGGAMRAGYRYAVRNDYTVVVQVDADGQHEPADVPRLLAELGPAELVIGSRFAGVGDYRVHGPRKWAMTLLARVLSRLAGHPLTDVTSGFKAVSGRALTLFAEYCPVEYLGDTVECLVIAIRAGCGVVELPTRMRRRRAGQPSHRPWKAGFYLLRACMALLLALVRRWDVQVPAPRPEIEEVPAS